MHDDVHDDAGAAVPVAGRPLWPVLSIFAVVYTVFLSLPALLEDAFPPREDLLWGDVVDFASPLAVFSALWLVLHRLGAHRDPLMLATLGAIAIVWAQGQGMHLAANAINHHLTVSDGTAGELTEFLDETLSHYLWYAATLALPGFFLLVGTRVPTRASAQPCAELPASLLFGVILALTVLEADVVPLALPLLAVTLAAGLIQIRWRSAHPRPALEFFATLSSAVCLVFLVAWAIAHGGFPELSEVGWI